MTVRHKLLESVAEQARYCFVNSAHRLNVKSDVAPEVVVGAHLSMENVDHKINVFLPTEDAFKLYLGLRDALRHVVEELSEEDKMHLRVQADRDAWGLRCYGNGRTSHIAEDLGL